MNNDDRTKCQVRRKCSSGLIVCAVFLGWSDPYDEPHCPHGNVVVLSGFGRPTDHGLKG